MTYVYLATPIKSTDHDTVRSRCDFATEIAAYLQDAMIPVFSPASHGYPISLKASIVQDWTYFQQIDIPILTNCCTHLVVICSPGWNCSTGVASEIVTAGDIGIPVIYYDPESMDRSVILEALSPRS